MYKNVNELWVILSIGVKFVQDSGDLFQTIFKQIKKINIKWIALHLPH